MLRYFCLMHVSDKSIIRRTRRNTLHDLGQLFLEIIHEPAIIFLYECRIVLTVVATNLGNGGILKLENTIEDSFHLSVFLLFHKEFEQECISKDFGNGSGYLLFQFSFACHAVNSFECVCKKQYQYKLTEKIKAYPRTSYQIEHLM